MNYKVKIKYNNYIRKIKEGILSLEFKEFLNKNKDRVFTTCKDPNRSTSPNWTFKENTDWLFPEQDLEIVSE